ncbi:MAG: NADH-quinone oxidoreductase subunit C [Pseudomonadota bacterium]
MHFGTVSSEEWQNACQQLVDGERNLLGFWGETGFVHMATLDEMRPGFDVTCLACPDGVFPSLARVHPPAGRLERAIHDLFGLTPIGSPDERPWLNHGRWGVGAAHAAEYKFLPAEGESLHQISVGPVHAGIIEPGHFRFTASGETIIRLEERLGYAHKGTESLMQGADIARAAKLAGRVSGDSTVAYAYAFARAVEMAAGIKVQPRAAWLRALMAELERLSNHFGDIGAVCNDASFSLMHAHCCILREQILRTSRECFGHRLMMDCVVPGGVAADLSPGHVGRLCSLVEEIRNTFPALVRLYDNTASLQDRMVETGILKPELARQFSCGGYVGRASGRTFDARKKPGYAPYDGLDFEVPTLEEGDVNARVWIRIKEVEQSLRLIAQILLGLPEENLKTVVLPESLAGAAEGCALVEGFRGDIFVWLRLSSDMRVLRCHLRDPSWFQWPLLESAIEGNIVADFPLCNKSFNCSYSGHDV